MYLYAEENCKYIPIFPPNLALWLTLTSSNYPVSNIFSWFQSVRTIEVQLYLWMLEKYIQMTYHKLILSHHLYVFRCLWQSISNLLPHISQSFITVTLKYAIPLYNSNSTSQYWFSSTIWLVQKKFNFDKSLVGTTWTCFLCGYY